MLWPPCLATRERDSVHTGSSSALLASSGCLSCLASQTLAYAAAMCLVLDLRKHVTLNEASVPAAAPRLAAGHTAPLAEEGRLWTSLGWQQHQWVGNKRHRVLQAAFRASLASPLSSSCAVLTRRCCRSQQVQEKCHVRAVLTSLHVQ